MQRLLKQLKSDESLMLAYQRGDSGAFEILYSRHKDTLFNFIFRSSNHPETVEDIAHDTWMSVIRSAQSYQPTAKFTTYLYRIARNKIIDHWRKQKPDEAAPGLDIDTLSDQANRSGMLAVEQLELIRELMQALQTLPFEQREAFLLKEEGFSQAEIADITQTKPETVKSRVRYARQSLRVLMEAPA